MKLLDSLPSQALTDAEEKALAVVIQKNQDDEDSINKLVLHNMAEAFRYMKGVCRSKMEDDEIFSLCYTTLRRNAKRFRPDGQVRFFAFAKAGLRGAISRFWTAQTLVKHATEVTSFMYFSANDWDDSRAETDKYGAQWKHPDLDMTEPVVNAAFDVIDLKERLNAVNAIIKSKLTEQEQMLIALVYTNGFNFPEVGKMLGITRSAVQSKHQKALEKIRRFLGCRGLLSEKP